MTREEAYNRIDAIIAKHEIDDEYVTITSILDYDALRMARKLLEQTNVLDKIETEMKQKIIKKPNMDFEWWERCQNDAILDVLDIIDKYKAESESKDCRRTQ